MFEELLARLPDIELAGPVAAPALELHQRHQAHAGAVHAGSLIRTVLPGSRALVVDAACPSRLVIAWPLERWRRSRRATLVRDRCTRIGALSQGVGRRPPSAVHSSHCSRSLPLVGGCIVDQSLVGPNSDMTQPFGGNIDFLGQTFTAGVSGELVGVNVDVEGVDTFPLTVAIRTVRDGPRGAQWHPRRSSGRSPSIRATPRSSRSPFASPQRSRRGRRRNHVPSDRRRLRGGQPVVSTARGSASYAENAYPGGDIVGCAFEAGLRAGGMRTGPRSPIETFTFARTSTSTPSEPPSFRTNPLRDDRSNVVGSRRFRSTSIPTEG